jgi:hypothetical protein
MHTAALKCPRKAPPSESIQQKSRIVLELIKKYYTIIALN